MVVSFFCLSPFFFLLQAGGVGVHIYLFLHCFIPKVGVGRSLAAGSMQSSLSFQESESSPIMAVKGIFQAILV